MTEAGDEIFRAYNVSSKDTTEDENGPLVATCTTYFPD